MKDTFRLHAALRDPVRLVRRTLLCSRIPEAAPQATAQPAQVREDTASARSAGSEPRPSRPGHDGLALVTPFSGWESSLPHLGEFWSFLSVSQGRYEREREPAWVRNHQQRPHRRGEGRREGWVRPRGPKAEAAEFKGQRRLRGSERRHPHLASQEPSLPLGSGELLLKL